MKDVEVPDSSTSWEAKLVCSQCSSSFTAEKADLEQDGFKKPGTYWFDGSADAAGITYRFFVKCPTCQDLILQDDDDLPLLVRREVSNSYLNGRR